jgi:hypothetical protein
MTCALDAGGEFDVVADVIGSLRKPVIKDPSALVVFVSMPVDAPPAVFPAQGDQSLYERLACAFSARSGRDEKVLQIASRAKAPGMGMENIVGESDGFTFWAECEEGTDRLARRKDTLPEAESGLIRNTTIEFRTISLPEAEPVPRIGRFRRANFYRSHGQKGVGCHIRRIPKVCIEHIWGGLSRTCAAAYLRPWLQHLFGYT